MKSRWPRNGIKSSIVDEELLKPDSISRYLSPASCSCSSDAAWYGGGGSPWAGRRSIADRLTAAARSASFRVAVWCSLRCCSNILIRWDSAASIALADARLLQHQWLSCYSSLRECHRPFSPVFFIKNAFILILVTMLALPVSHLFDTLESVGQLSVRCHEKPQCYLSILNKPH